MICLNQIEGIKERVYDNKRHKKYTFFCLVEKHMSGGRNDAEKVGGGDAFATSIFPVSNPSLQLIQVLPANTPRATQNTAVSYNAYFSGDSITYNIVQSDMLLRGLLFTGSTAIVDQDGNFLSGANSTGALYTGAAYNFHPSLGYVGGLFSSIKMTRFMGNNVLQDVPDLPTICRFISATRHSTDFIDYSGGCGLYPCFNDASIVPNYPWQGGTLLSAMTPATGGNPARTVPGRVMKQFAFTFPLTSLHAGYPIDLNVSQGLSFNLLVARFQDSCTVSMSTDGNTVKTLQNTLPNTAGGAFASLLGNNAAVANNQMSAWDIYTNGKPVVITSNGAAANLQNTPACAPIATQLVIIDPKLYLFLERKGPGTESVPSQFPFVHIALRKIQLNYGLTQNFSITIKEEVIRNFYFMMKSSTNISTACLGQHNTHSFAVSRMQLELDGQRQIYAYDTIGQPALSQWSFNTPNAFVYTAARDNFQKDAYRRIFEGMYVFYDYDTGGNGVLFANCVVQYRTVLKPFSFIWQNNPWALNPNTYVTTTGWPFNMQFQYDWSGNTVAPISWLQPSMMTGESIYERNTLIPANTYGIAPAGGFPFPPGLRSMPQVQIPLNNALTNFCTYLGVSPNFKFALVVDPGPTDTSLVVCEEEATLVMSATAAQFIAVTKPAVKLPSILNFRKCAGISPVVRVTEEYINATILPNPDPGTIILDFLLPGGGFPGEMYLNLNLIPVNEPLTQQMPAFNSDVDTVPPFLQPLASNGYNVTSGGMGQVTPWGFGFVGAAAFNNAWQVGAPTGAGTFNWYVPIFAGMGYLPTLQSAGPWFWANTPIPASNPATVNAPNPAAAVPKGSATYGLLAPYNNYKNHMTYSSLLGDATLVRRLLWFLPNNVKLDFPNLQKDLFLAGYGKSTAASAAYSKFISHRSSAWFYDPTYNNQYRDVLTFRQRNGMCDSWNSIFPFYTDYTYPNVNMSLLMSSPPGTAVQTNTVTMTDMQSTCPFIMQINLGEIHASFRKMRTVPYTPDVARHLQIHLDLAGTSLANVPGSVAGGVTTTSNPCRFLQGKMVTTINNANPQEVIHNTNWGRIDANVGTSLNWLSPGRQTSETVCGFQRKIPVGFCVDTSKRPPVLLAECVFYEPQTMERLSNKFKTDGVVQRYSQFNYMKQYAEYTTQFTDGEANLSYVPLYDQINAGTTIPVGGYDPPLCFVTHKFLRNVNGIDTAFAQPSGQEQPRDDCSQAMLAAGGGNYAAYDSFLDRVTIPPYVANRDGQIAYSVPGAIEPSANLLTSNNKLVADYELLIDGALMYQFRVGSNFTNQLMYAATFREMIARPAWEIEYNADRRLKMYSEPYMALHGTNDNAKIAIQAFYGSDIQKTGDYFAVSGIFLQAADVLMSYHPACNYLLNMPMLPPRFVIPLYIYGSGRNGNTWLLNQFTAATAPYLNWLTGEAVPPAGGRSCSSPVQQINSHRTILAIASYFNATVLQRELAMAYVAEYSFNQYSANNRNLYPVGYGQF